LAAVFRFDVNSRYESSHGHPLKWLDDVEFAFRRIDVRRTLGRSDLTLNYVGGGLTADNTNSGASLVQQLEFREKLTYRRTVISFLEQLSYLPEPAFGSYVSGGQSFSDARDYRCNQR